MKIIINKILPFRGYAAMAVKPYIFIQKKWYDSLCDKRGVLYRKTINHEKIHLAQQEELGLLKFLVIYIFWWIKDGYRQIPFEKEAYANASDFTYLQRRKPYAYKKYIHY